MYDFLRNKWKIEIRDFLYQFLFVYFLIIIKDLSFKI